MKVALRLSFAYSLTCLLACNSSNNNTAGNHQQKLQDSSVTDKIFISFKGYDSSNLGIAWFYYDDYNQQIKINPRADSISVSWSGKSLLEYATIPQTGYYPVLAGDSIVITKNISDLDYPKIAMRSNKFSTFELNFPSFLSERNSSVFEYSVRKIPNKLFPLNGNAKQYYDRAVLITDSCVKAGIIGSNYDRWIKKTLKYSFYNEALWAKELPDSVLSNTLGKMQPDMSNGLYRNLLQNYFFKIVLKGKNDFKNGYAIAKKRYSGERRDFLLMACLLQIVKGTEADKEKYIALFNADCQNKSYKDYIDQSYTSLLSKGAAKKDIVVNSDKKAFSLDSLLTSFTDNLIYIDNWASWCSPCREEMPNSEKLRQRYIGKNIKFIFLSIDDNYSNWVKANNDEKLNANSYLLMNVNESFFNKKYKIRTIPRYMLIDKKGNIINADAPRPGDPKLKDLIDKNL